MILSHGLDGVFYPSVRTQGQGFNVAIKPEIADSHLELVVAGECSIYKYLDHTVIDNDTIVEVEPNQTNFVFNAVDPVYHAGETECLKQLGLTSAEDLRT